MSNYFDHDGQRTTLHALALQTGLNYYTLRKRYDKGQRGAVLVRLTAPGWRARAGHATAEPK